MVKCYGFFFALSNWHIYVYVYYLLLVYKPSAGGVLYTGEVVCVNGSRLLLCEATANVMKQGFTILGLSTVERMWNNVNGCCYVKPRLMSSIRDSQYLDLEQLNECETDADYS